MIGAGRCQLLGSGEILDRGMPDISENLSTYNSTGVASNILVMEV